jgi:hypothetical protein
MLPQQLVEEVESLRAKGFVVDLVAADGIAATVFQAYSVPRGYSQSVTDLLLKFPLSYPNGKPDMFWTDVALTLEGGKCPKQADTIETILARQWRRFSWHPQAWNPGIDDLRTYLEFVNTGLTKAKNP